tara:strand:- start:141 stop:851 length:711 start_codon:yes stop_codon:yes gene_type:complete
MLPMLKFLNPFTPFKRKVINTSWGSIDPDVDIFPVAYLLFIYGFIYILPYGRDVVGMSWFDWCRSEDGPLEWIQFIGYFLGFIFSSLILYKRRRMGINKKWIAWLILALICFFVAGEEISWGERITGIGIDSIRAINSQRETSIHNIHFFHHYLLDPSFEISCLLLGWIGWRAWPSIDAFPTKRYSLYFLFVALFYFYFDITQASTISQIRNDQEIFEVLMSLGLSSHCWNKALSG